MFHKFIHSDNGVDCYRCGMSIDYPWMPMDDLIRSGHLVPDEDVRNEMERQIMFFVPNCNGPSDNRGHHYFAHGADKDDGEHLIGSIECHYGDAHIGFETDLAYVPRYCKGD